MFLSLNQQDHGWITLFKIYLDNTPPLTCLHLHQGRHTGDPQTTAKYNNHTSIMFVSLGIY